MAWASTIHKFQGHEAGKEQNDSIKTILADPGSLGFENTNPGTLFTVVSRVRTLGNLTEGSKNHSSSLYFVGDNMCYERVLKIGFTSKNERAKKFIQRDQFVNHLKQRLSDTNQRLNRQWFNSTEKAVLEEMEQRKSKFENTIEKEIANAILFFKSIK